MDISNLLGYNPLELAAATGGAPARAPAAAFAAAGRRKSSGCGAAAGEPAAAASEAGAGAGGTGSGGGDGRGAAWKKSAKKKSSKAKRGSKSGGEDNEGDNGAESSELEPMSGFSGLSSNEHDSDGDSDGGNEEGEKRPGAAAAAAGSRTAAYARAGASADALALPSARGFDPAAELDDIVGIGVSTKEIERAVVQPKIHVRLQQRNSRSSLTTVQGLDAELDLKRICKAMRRSFACNGTVLTHKTYGEVVQLQGDQREAVRAWLVENELLTEEEADDRVRLHGPGV